MPTLQIREIPQDIYDNLVKSAKMSRRSLTQEAILLLEKGLSIEDHKIKKLQVLEKIKKMPKLKNITMDKIVASIREDRDR